MSGGVLLSHPTGNANVRQALLALHERGMLSAFFTAVAWNGDAAWNRLLPAQLSRALKRRSFPGIPGAMIHTSPARELFRVALGRSGRWGLQLRTDLPFSVEAVYRHTDKVAAKALESLPLEAMYAYDGGALATFRAARRLGIRTIYELPTAYTVFKREFFHEEAELQPAYAGTFQKALDDEAWLRRKEEELALADVVVVPSDYVRSTLPASEAGKAEMLPYGAPPAVEGRAFARRGTAGKLRVLYVGALSQGKGISYLLDAMKRVGAAVEFTIIGARVGPCRPLDEALGRYRWMHHLSHRAVLEAMGQHDVLAFPTLSEGLALVILEAMSRGMAVVTTPNSGAAGIIRDGKEGFVIPIRSSEALAERIALLAADRALLAAMQEAALARAKEYSWERYRERLAETVAAAMRSQEAAARA
jgi:starch synthase